MKKFILAFALMLIAATPARAAEDLMGMYQGYAADSNVALDKAHRGLNELSDWISDVAADALVFTPAKTAQKLAAIRPLFSEGGYTAYKAFLDKMGFADAIVNQTLNISAIVNREPLLIGQGASAGRYAWAFEVPVVLSVADKAGTQPVSKNVTLRIQFGRSAKGAPPHGLLIENWQETAEEPAADTQEPSGQPAVIP